MLSDTGSAEQTHEHKRQGGFCIEHCHLMSMFSQQEATRRGVLLSKRCATGWRAEERIRQMGGSPDEETKESGLEARKGRKQVGKGVLHPWPCVPRQTLPGR